MNGIIERLRDPGSDVTREEAASEIERLRAALQFAIDGWDNQDINHTTYRVEVFKVASDALASSDFIECPTCMRRWRGDISCDVPTCSLRGIR